MKAFSVLLAASAMLAVLSGGSALAQGPPRASGILLNQIETTKQPQSKGRNAPDPLYKQESVGPSFGRRGGGGGAPAGAPPAGGGPVGGAPAGAVPVGAGPPGGAPAGAPPAGAGFGGGFGGDNFSARDGAVPAGVTPLDRDVFTTKDFYLDKSLWTNPLYYRCSSPQAIEQTWGAVGPGHQGDNFPTSVPWGYCDRDYPMDQMVSPYAYKTAREQYEALKAEAATRGGPTKYSRDKMPPDWNGVYNRYGFSVNRGGWSWFSSSNVQASTYIKLLTPEYQQRFVQMLYHEAHNQINWPGAYCWPEGYLRWWFDDWKWIQVSPEVVQIKGRVASPMQTQVMINRDFDMKDSVPNLLGDVRQYYGDTIGFWDGDALITWTSNIKHWTAHPWFEHSDNLQVIDIYTPLVKKSDKSFVGLKHETVLYDPDALVRPVRIVENMERNRALNEGAPYDYRECLQTLFPVNGLQAPVTPGATIEFTVPDLNGRPWADIWEKYWEQGMQRPKPKDPLAGF